jgi:hypothetical protein
MDVAARGKSELMDEWQRLPLGSRNHQYDWWVEKSGGCGPRAAEESDWARPSASPVSRNLDAVDAHMAEAITAENMQSGIALEHFPSSWEPPNMQRLENVRVGAEIAQPMEGIHDVHPSLTSTQTQQREAPSPSPVLQRSGNSSYHPRPPSPVENVNVARAYAAVHKNKYF